MDLNKGRYGPADIDTNKENAFRATHWEERSQLSRLTLEIEIWPTPDRSGWSRPPQSCQTENLHKYRAEPLGEKNAHLTYYQKLFIYTQHRYEGKEIRHIWNTFRVSIYTVMRIIKLFRSNLEREKIYQGIKYRKSISCPVMNE